MITTAIPVTRSAQPRLSSYDFSNIVFGANPTDHMFLARYRQGEWQDAQIVPFGNLELNPLSLCLHYGQTVFEGLKAYRQADGTVSIFRGDKHQRRFNRSLERMCMPEVPEALFTDALRSLISLDQDWVPSQPGSSLYIRPFVIATEARLGVKVADEYLFLITCMPMGAYFSNNIKVKVETQYVRAAAGGTGAAKCGGNYGASFYPTTQARQQGFDQVLWTDSQHHEFIEESGMMNIMFVLDNVLVTPPLNGNLLDGVTRDTLLSLARDAGISVEERNISYKELEQAFAAGRKVEAFGSGTAASIAPIELISINGTSYATDVSEQALYHRLKEALQAVRTGNSPDPHQWNYVIADETI
jgi:branched-chain amino acid aminotransferase